MFNLDDAVAKWRRQMAASGIKSPQVLDELESHLREEISHRINSGEDAQQALVSAVQRMGEPAALRSEFAKSEHLQRRGAFIQGLCFCAAGAILLINTWTLMRFDLSALERLGGLFATALVALYLASLPFLRKLLSGVAFGRLIAAFKISTFLMSALSILMVLTFTKLIHIEMGIVPHM